MPSSLIFAALAVAWLVILVPMVARRRHDGVRTEDSVPTGRVVRSGRSTQRAARGELVARSRLEEAFAMSDAQLTGETGARGGDMYDSESHEDGDVEPRRYRPGRGGFDPQAAAIAARAKYAARQRIVLFLLLTALATGLLAWFATTVLWWAHGCVDVLLVSYLSYLRRQGRIEEDVRRRRTARMARAARRTQAMAAAAPAPAQPADERIEDEPEGLPPPRTTPPGTVVLELDDDDPAFDDLDEPAPAAFRRAAGE